MRWLHGTSRPQIEISKKFQREKISRSSFGARQGGSWKVTAVFVCGGWRKKVNAQRLSPVSRWAFYTVACTALCGRIAENE